MQAVTQCDADVRLLQVCESCSIVAWNKYTRAQQKCNVQCAGSKSSHICARWTGSRPPSYTSKKLALPCSVEVPSHTQYAKRAAEQALEELHLTQAPSPANILSKLPASCEYFIPSFDQSATISDAYKEWADCTSQLLIT